MMTVKNPLRWCVRPDLVAASAGVGSVTQPPRQASEIAAPSAAGREPAGPTSDGRCSSLPGPIRVGAQ